MNSENTSADVLKNAMRLDIDHRAITHGLSLITYGKSDFSNHHLKHPKINNCSIAYIRITCPTSSRRGKVELLNLNEVKNEIFNLTPEVKNFRNRMFMDHKVYIHPIHVEEGKRIDDGEDIGISIVGLLILVNKGVVTFPVR